MNYIVVVDTEFFTIHLNLSDGNALINLLMKCIVILLCQLLHSNYGDS